MFIAISFALRSANSSVNCSPGDAIRRTFKSSKRAKNQTKKHQCPHQEPSHNAEKHLLARRAVEGSDVCNT